MSSPLRIDAFTFDVALAATADAAVQRLAEHIEKSDAEIILFPEYTWAPSLPLVPDRLQVFWNETVPALARHINSTERFLVLGTAPAWDEATQSLRNRAIILSDGRVLTQDKLFLTPWETAFSGGQGLHLFRFRGLMIAVVICLDIEVPEISVALRDQKVDLILVPSATETILGAERVTRCASARSVELGCAVVVSPLVGRCSSDLVDDNLGKLAAYHPSQASFNTAPRSSETSLITEGIHKLSSHMDSNLLAQMRTATSETNPSLLSRWTKFKPIKLIHF